MPPTWAHCCNWVSRFPRRYELPGSRLSTLRAFLAFEALDRPGTRSRHDDLLRREARCRASPRREWARPPVGRSWARMCSPLRTKPRFTCGQVSNGGVGAQYDGDAHRERESVYQYWAGKQGNSAQVGALSATGSRYCGLDLAWSAGNASGIAVVDGAGHLLESATVSSDDEIASWLAPHLSQLKVVAVDAPLVVPNMTGSRPVEAELSRAYASAHAGALPSNRCQPLFNPPRGEILDARFGWRIGSARPSADSGEAPACIEV